MTEEKSKECLEKEVLLQLQYEGRVQDFQKWKQGEKVKTIK